MRGASDSDTIAAVATAAGRGGIGVVRVSGGRVPGVARAVLGRLPRPRYATLANFQDADGSVIDTGISLYFPGPASFTGEDVLELQGHGGPVVMDMLLERVVSLGVRLAEPGEFSRRAFLNDKIDLAQAEAIADLIDSVSQQAAKGAMRSLEGQFSSKITELSELVVNLRMYVEAAMDFPEEEVDFLSDARVSDALSQISAAIGAVREQASQGALLREGIRLVLAGRPNAGKSSLMNRLTGSESSIVTTVPGTTRDVVREHIHLDGIPLHLVDTAGIRASDDEVEIEGVRRAVSEATGADLVLVVVDWEAHETDWRAEVDKLLAEMYGTDLPTAPDVTVVLNKRDLVASAAPASEGVVAVSAKTGHGIADLSAHIRHRAGARAFDEGTFTARRRHIDALGRAAAHLRTGGSVLSGMGAGELLAEELRLAHESLSEITGAFSADDLLGEIFASFCIGK